MQYRINAKSGDKLSALGYGCMRLPEKNGRIERQKAEAQIFSAIDRGVNYIDTAFPYHRGASEPFLGSILKERRKDIFLATKLPPGSVHKYEDMDIILNRQLERLATENIDYYMLHGINDVGWDKFEGLGAPGFLEKAKKDGKIRQAGFSFHGDLETFKRILDTWNWDFCQIQYNYLDIKNQAGTEGLKYAAAKGVPVFVMEPLRGGMLGGNMPKKILDMIDRFEPKRSPAEWSLRWILDHPEVNMVLSGMNQEEHVDENIRICSESGSGCMTEAESGFIDKVRDSFLSGLEIGCTGCRYCVPCPAGVDIPYNFEIYNRVKFFGESKFPDNNFRYWTHLGYGEKTDKQFYASKCIECGKCVKHCPQAIDIPAKLKKVAREMETFTARRILPPFFRFFLNRARG